MAKKRLQDEHGVVLVVSALAMVGLLIIAAFAIDLGYARQVARNEQAATDGASLAAAQSLPTSGADPVLAAAAREQARVNIASSLGGTPSECAMVDTATCEFTVGDFDVTVITPYDLPGSTIPDDQLVFVEACGPSPAFFSRVAGNDGMTVCRSAVARNLQTAPGYGIGLLALKPSGCTFDINGTNDVELSSNGAVIVNSSGQDPDSAVCGGGSTSWSITSDYVGIVGDIDDQVKTENFEATDPDSEPTIETGIDPVDDPFSGVPDVPTDPPFSELADEYDSLNDACPVTTLKKDSPLGMEERTCSPGRYALEDDKNPGFAAGTFYHFEPGVYVFEKSVTVGANTKLNSMPGTGVLFYFAVGSLKASGSSEMVLAPLSYPTADANDDGIPDDERALFNGLSIYQARGNLEPMEIGGTPGAGVGSVYVPDASLTFNGTPDKIVNGIVVVGNIIFKGTAFIQINVPEDSPEVDPVVSMGLER